ncbi:Ribonuclease H [Halanaerobium praevalens DSM 2228]|uniref:Ribonuclease H n=1 Tax=Halanaerobium praevalens (strain ATCC 33744 / DSM 2228 / GSL) TaxID=572479 RepID=E3DQG3_HALPG|nr:ribonuclease HI [Halanaerobium praevalens]ADO76859.1 Ribonuclease H [Halanaerobium praevalens DSM 2228]
MTNEKKDMKKINNDCILEEKNLNVKEFAKLESEIYQKGKLSTEIKELLAFVSALVLRAEDSTQEHLQKVYQAGWSKEEIYEAMNIALINGGAVVRPTLNKAIKFLNDLEADNLASPKSDLKTENFVSTDKDLTNYQEFKLYTDGACLGNPGPGGYAAFILNNNLEELTSVSGSTKESTNNRMELKAVIEALKVIPQKTKVEIYSDSSYVLNGLSKWIKAWKKNGWKTASKKEVANQDLWKKLDELSTNFDLVYKKVKGHSGDQYNEKADKLAKKEAEKI